ncbi:survival protein sure-like phosphatase/nucleotidase [Neurospora tetraspora]|uniref:Survival protein sure-like phosphatase/nucleotidase n=1 Tax=Neurospora tetraspora TaxID=94610 RepID=A0AAE0JCP0_9PEZI|nr:survival protein sure-like phosphatase/nucleotidase [Neurospora tetraspora]
MHILVVNDDGPPSPHSSPYVHSLVRDLQAAGHIVSVCLPHTQRSWIGKAHMIGQTVKPLYYRPPPASSPAAGLTTALVSDSSPEKTETTAVNVTDHGSTHPRPSTVPGTEEWILVDGTPASCVQIGLYHFFQDRGPIDLVVSGPNYGRNTTAVFALSSGTLGGALEAAVCKRRAIALSYAFFNRNHDPAIIAKASRQSVRVIEALWKQWPEDGSVDLYSVNVPLLEKLEEGKVLYTPMLQNYWGAGSCFEEVEGSVYGEEEDEERIREGGEAGRAETDGGEAIGKRGGRGGGLHTHKHFKWSPRFTDVYKSVEEAPPGNDGWAVKEGHTSVTPLKANFWNTAENLHGKELQLPPLETPSSATKTELTNLPIRESSTTNSNCKDHLYALIDYQDAYVQPLILSALQKLLPSSSYTLLPSPFTPSNKDDLEIHLSSLVPSAEAKILQITPYETIDFDHALSHPTTTLINSYIIRKALIRKHFLSSTVENWVAKHPSSALKTHVKRAEAFEVDYAEFLDDSLVEAFDLRASLEKNDQLIEGGNPEKVEWWILKPSMSDRGQGIRLFSTMEELQSIFDGWEVESESDFEDEDEDDNNSNSDAGEATQKDDNDNDNDADSDSDANANINTSHLRHFIAQPYIHPPLLLPELQNRKFHIRVYVLAIGALKVYVYKDMLALFAGTPYTPPTAPTSFSSDPSDPNPDAEPTEMDLSAHLTNTCLQTYLSPNAAENSVHRFWDLPTLSPVHFPQAKAEEIWDQICQVTGELFEAAARGMMIHFQPMEQAFEVYGLDFLVDADADGEGNTAWLLEVNAFPDFKQTGELKGVVGGFWEGVVREAVGGFVGAEGVGKGDDEKMRLVREVDLGRRW